MNSQWACSQNMRLSWPKRKWSADQHHQWCYWHGERLHINSSLSIDCKNTKNKCISSMVKRGGRVLGRGRATGVGEMLHCENSLNALENMRILQKVKTCYPKRNYQMLFFNKSMLLRTLQRQPSALRTSPSVLACQSLDYYTVLPFGIAEIILMFLKSLKLRKAVLFLCLQYLSNSC